MRANACFVRFLRHSLHRKAKHQPELSQLSSCPDVGMYVNKLWTEILRIAWAQFVVSLYSLFFVSLVIRCEV